RGVGVSAEFQKGLEMKTMAGGRTFWGWGVWGNRRGGKRPGRNLQRGPRHDVSPQFLKHSVLLSEFFVGLVPQDGKHPAKIPANFRWIPGEYLDLPFSEYVPESRESRSERRRLQPDAVIEIPVLRKRYFAEIETGSA